MKTTSKILIIIGLFALIIVTPTPFAKADNVTVTMKDWAIEGPDSQYSADAVYVKLNGDVFTNQLSIPIVNYDFDQVAGLIFRDLNITAGTNINNATLNLYFLFNFDSFDAKNVTIYGYNSEIGNGNFSNLNPSPPVTSAFTNFLVSNVTSEGWYEIDVRNIVQEMVNRGWYASSDTIGFIIFSTRESEITARRNFQANAGNKEPYLFIEFGATDAAPDGSDQEFIGQHQGYTIFRKYDGLKGLILAGQSQDTYFYQFNTTEWKKPSGGGLKSDFLWTYKHNLTASGMYLRANVDSGKDRAVVYDGKLYVAAYDGTLSTADLDLYCANLSDLTSWSNVLTIEGGSTILENFDIAYYNNTLYVGWANSGGMFFKRVHLNNLTTSGEIQVHVGLAGFTSTGCDILVDETNGDIYFTGSTPDAGSSRRKIRLAYSDDNGASWIVGTVVSGTDQTFYPTMQLYGNHAVIIFEYGTVGSYYVVSPKGTVALEAPVAFGVSSLSHAWGIDSVIVHDHFDDRGDYNPVMYAFPQKTGTTDVMAFLQLYARSNGTWQILENGAGQWYNNSFDMRNFVNMRIEDDYYVASGMVGFRPQFPTNGEMIDKLSWTGFAGPGGWDSNLYMNPLPPNVQSNYHIESTLTSSWTVYDENGTLITTLPTDEYPTNSSVIEWINGNLLDGGAWDDPDPEGWVGSDWFTRPKMRVYFFVLGLGFIFGPLYYYALRGWTLLGVVKTVFVIIIGFGFLRAIIFI